MEKKKTLEPTPQKKWAGSVAIQSSLCFFFQDIKMASIPFIMHHRNEIKVLL